MKEKLLSALQKRPYFLVLLPLFFIAHGYNEFFGFFSFNFILLNLVLTGFCTGVLFLVTLFYFKNKEKTSLFTFWLLLFILTFGETHDILKQLFKNGFISSYKFILPFSLFLFFALAFYIKNKKQPFTRTYLFFHLLLITFALYEGIAAIGNYQKLKNGSNIIDNRFTAVSEYKPIKQIPDTLKPDIYFLVFDAMPSTKAMKAEWKYDNSNLDSFLNKQGFYIAADSRSNYNITLLSVTSCFNMNYYHEKDIFNGGEIKTIIRGLNSLSNNPLQKILKKENYTVIQSEPLSFQNKPGVEKSFFQDIIDYHFYYKTLPGRMYKDLGWQLSKIKVIRSMMGTLSEKKFESNKRRLNYTIQKIKESCSQQHNPQFVYAHFMLPHAPFIFDSSGSIKSLKEIQSLKLENHPKAFIEQVKFANTIIKDLLLYIKQNNKRNTIIIIAGDHGFRNASGSGYMIFDNLNTVYLPDQNYQSFYSSMSLVNTFRLILNKHFYSTMPILVDSSIFIPYNISKGKK